MQMQTLAIVVTMSCRMGIGPPNCSHDPLPAAQQGQCHPVPTAKGPQVLSVDSRARQAWPRVLREGFPVSIHPWPTLGYGCQEPAYPWHQLQAKGLRQRSPLSENKWAPPSANGQTQIKIHVSPYYTWVQRQIRQNPCLKCS